MLIIVLYQFYLVPRIISPMVVQHWLDEIESGRIDLPKVLESYTGELLGQVDALFLVIPMLKQKKHRGRIQNFTRAQLVKLRKRWAVRRRDSAPTS